MIYVAAAQEIETWFICFHSRCSSRFWQRAIPGRFKHVRAFAWVEGVRAWVFYDVWLTGGSRIVVSPGGETGDALVGQYVDGAAVLKLRRLPEAAPSLSTLIGFWCVPAVRRLLNLPGGALRPDALWRECLARGAEIIIHERPHPGAGPGASPAKAAGAGECVPANPEVPGTADAGHLVDVRGRDAA